MGAVASVATRGVEMVAGPLIRSAETAVVTYVRPIATRVAEEVVTQVGSIAGQTVADQLQSAINAGLNIADAAGSAPGGISDPNAENALITAQNNALLLMMGGAVSNGLRCRRAGARSPVQHYQSVRQPVG